MNFFDSFWKASFYKDGHAVSFWKAFWKVVLVMFIVSLVFATLSHVTLGKKIPAYVDTYTKKALAEYPSELVVTIRGGTLSKNIKGELQLYTIPKDIFGKEYDRDSLPEYLVTINDVENVSLEAYKKSNSLVLLAKDGMVMRDDKGIKIAPYSEMEEGRQPTEDFIFTKDMIVKGVDVVNEYKERMPAILFGSIVIFWTLFAPLGYLTVTLLYGLIVMLLSTWIIGRKLAYSESYILSLYALAPVIVVSNVLQIVPHISKVVTYIPFLSLMLLVLFLGYMFREKGNVASHEVDVK